MTHKRMDCELVNLSSCHYCSLLEYVDGDSAQIKLYTHKAYSSSRIILYYYRAPVLYCTVQKMTWDTEQYVTVAL
jgi:hypothetical protein